MIGILWDWMKTRRATAHAERRLWEGYASAIDRMNQLYVDTDRMNFDARLGSVAAGLARMEPKVSREEAQAVALELFKKNPFGRNIVNQIRNHVVGPGFALKWQNPDQQKTYDALAIKYNLPRRFVYFVRNCKLFGEVFFIKSNGKLRAVPACAVKTPTEYVSDPRYEDGVELADADDPESVLGYHIEGEFFPRMLVFHWKDIDVDDDCQRGWPLLFDAREVLEEYRKFMSNRARLNDFRTNILMFKKIIGANAAQVSAVVDRAKTGTLQRPIDGKAQPFEWLPGVGRVITSNDKVEYDLKNPNTGASEAEADGRAMRLQGATFVQFAEWLYSSDASNANFASTQVAESPFVKAMMMEQEWQIGGMLKLVAWLEPSLAEPRGTYVAPPLVSRDAMKEAQANQILWNAQVMSAETWQERAGLDPKQEASRIAAAGTASMEDVASAFGT